MGEIRSGVGALKGVGALGEIGALRGVGVLLLLTSDFSAEFWEPASSSCSPMKLAKGLL